ncbi:hypothetical protein VD0002_g2555 [Verticillium dahliae]|uniref:Uncharacterized protein n=1 Tax=Verticillium dahliae TaxID=27337 RepID=A0AA44WDG4_VERDA|nr:hypothetical protein BJF96_g8200 [Verticillium dahliae]PNH53506.1 hypothetical protein VD0003_g3892 [Verticillium dahliae]PNH67001.1 hypothetical protein VD0002_g2555 [Verticillium dahliae]
MLHGLTAQEQGQEHRMNQEDREIDTGKVVRREPSQSSSPSHAAAFQVIAREISRPTSEIDLIIDTVIIIAIP